MAEMKGGVLGRYGYHRFNRGEKCDVYHFDDNLFGEMSKLLRGEAESKNIIEEGCDEITEIEGSDVKLVGFSDFTNIAIYNEDIFRRDITKGKLEEIFA